MADAKMVDAIVRGPQPYFHTDGVLYMPGQVVSGVPAADVSEDNTREIEAEFEANNGDLRTRKVDKLIQFRPIDGAVIAGPVTTADVATGNPDRLNVADFLKQGPDEIVAAIVSGSVDDHLGVIEQQEIVRKGTNRKAVTDAVSMRLAAMHRN